MREHIYLSLEKHLHSPKVQSIFTRSKLPKLKSIDLFYGQYLATEKHDTFLAPSLFLEINTEFSPNPRLAEGNATITTHLILKNLYFPHKYKSTKSENYPQQLFTYHRTLREAIQGSSSQHFRKPILVAQEALEFNGTLISVKDTYTTICNDFFQASEKVQGKVGTVVLP